MRFARKRRNLGGKFHRQIEPGKQCFRVEEGIHSCYLVAREFKDNEGPGLVTAVRMHAVLAKSR